MGRDEEMPHFDNPKNDNELLLNYQYEYKNGNVKALNGMYKKGYLIAMKYISVNARKNKHIAILSESDKQEKAHNAITYIIERYFKVANWYIKKSFTAYLYMRVKHELYYVRKVDALIDYVGMEDLITIIERKQGADGYWYRDKTQCP